MYKEIWKPVKDYEGLYEVSNKGRVRSLSHFIEAIKGHPQLIGISKRIRSTEDNILSIKASKGP